MGGVKSFTVAPNEEIYAITNVTYTEDHCSVCVDVSNILSGKIIACTYKNKQLNEYQIKKYTSVTEKFEFARDIDEIKIMVWNDTVQVFPLCKAETIKVKE